jgi:hypothetical protein
MPPASIGAAGLAAPRCGTGTPAHGSMRGLMVVGVVIVALVGIGCVFGVVKYVIKPRVQSSRALASQPVDHKALTYPGARTVLDVTSGSGAGVLQLQTSDDIDKVANWYLEHLKPTKSVRVGSMVVLKTSNVTLTLVSDSGSTNIMIKQTP